MFLKLFVVHRKHNFPTCQYILAEDEITFGGAAQTLAHHAVYLGLLG